MSINGLKKILWNPIFYSILFPIGNGNASDKRQSENNFRANKSHNRNRRFDAGRNVSKYDGGGSGNGSGARYKNKSSKNNDEPSSPGESGSSSRWENNRNYNQHYNSRGGTNSEYGPPSRRNAGRFQDERRRPGSERNHSALKNKDDQKSNRNNQKEFDNSSSQRERLIREIDSGKLECLVCCEKIKPFHPTWSCPNCYHIIHLNCISKWAASSKSDEGWRCCACQNVNKAVPRTYYCFCGKEKNPQYNRNDVAHTCGNVCGRSDNCEHRCTQLCHPGPCPPCHVMVTRTCGCGRSSRTMQCCQKDDVECDQICDKPLNCGIHNCNVKCHRGPCIDCNQQIEQVCYCGRDKRDAQCTVENSLKYSCDKVCNKTLNCDNHQCTDKCHPGPCAECKLVPEAVTSCPCGKIAIEKGERTSCLDPVPLCANTCRKPLSCGQASSPHICMSKCHAGQCPPCNKQTYVKCRCGNMDQKIKCTQLLSDDARCKKRCTKKRSCGRHKCNLECCIDIDHICPMPCSFNLSCGKHKCDQNCHKGRCLPCYRSSFEELYCECGVNVIYPPVPCGTKRLGVAA